VEEELVEGFELNPYPPVEMLVDDDGDDEDFLSWSSF
jgi:hypothetical protein